MAAKPEINEKSRDLNIFFQIKMKQCSVADTKTGGVLGGVIFKLDIL